MPKSRKLILPSEAPIFPPATLSALSSSISPASSKIESESLISNDNTYTNSSSGNTKLSQPFDSSMALTILVLLTALFFMGFCSIYVRRFADDSSVDFDRRRRRAESLPALSSSPYARKRKGADPAVVEALPVYGYDRGTAKQGNDETECAICLSEFEERESVKVIPFCGHVFHAECIDTWLSSHVTCPLCRTEELFAPVVVVAGAEESGLGVARVQRGSESDASSR